MAKGLQISYREVTGSAPVGKTRKISEYAYVIDDKIITSFPRVFLLTKNADEQIVNLIILTNT